MRKLTPLTFVLLASTLAFADDKPPPHAKEITAFAHHARAARDQADKSHDGRAGAIFKLCLRAYDQAIAAGVPPSQPVKENDLDGTLEDLKTSLCDAGSKKLQDKIDAREAPYRKVLKNDKFDTWKSYSAAIVLPGQADASKPENLARADHWYVDTSPSESCPGGGQKHRLHRYQFDGDQKLTKTTDADFCGDPPSSAYK